MFDQCRIAKIERSSDFEMRLNFKVRSPCDAQELSVFTGAITAVPLGNIAWNRDGGTSDLAREAKKLFTGKRLG